jgi:hypothetical protein
VPSVHFSYCGGARLGTYNVGLRLRPVHRIFVSWLAILAMVMAALAPAVSHALGKSSPVTWAEICTTGSKRVAVEGDAAGKNSVPGPAHLLEHCPFCSLHGAAMGMPPASDLAIAVVTLPAETPAAFLHAARTQDVWVSAQPRAPPVPV